LEGRLRAGRMASARFITTFDFDRYRCSLCAAG
jgi:hypothetical protein